MDSGQPPGPGDLTPHVLALGLFHWKVTYHCTSGLLSVKWSETIYLPGRFQGFLSATPTVHYMHVAIILTQAQQTGDYHSL